MYKRADYTEVKEYIESQGYQLLSDAYKNNRTKLQLLCPVEHLYEVTYEKFKIRGHRCSKCKGNARLSLKDIQEFVKPLGHRVLSNQYVNARTPIDFSCRMGHHFSRQWDVLRKTPHCPSCKGTEGERLVHLILKNLIPNITVYPYHTEKISKEEYVIFDFYIPLENQFLYIEYDGRQHFGPVDYFGGEAGFQETIKRDQRKNEWVSAHKNRFLLRVDCKQTDRQVFESIRQFLSKFAEVSNVLYADLDRTLVYENSVSAEEIANYYLTHTKEQTAEKFGISKESTYKVFERVYGCSKTDYRKKQIADYCKTHTIAEARRAFKASYSLVKNALRQ